jgi:hypothetical protein
MTFEELFQQTSDGKLRLVPDFLKVGENIYERVGELLLSEGDILLKVRWHDHIGKEVEGISTELPDGRTMIEVKGFLK